MSGKFIVVEGLEGAGKSSAINCISEAIKQIGHSVVCTREPGGTPMAEAIRECVKNNWQETVTQEAELLLMYAARVQLLHNVIKPAMAQGKWVVGDRHDMSTQAYQGGGRGIASEKLTALRSISLGNFTPDFTLYLDVEPEVGLQRARGRGELDRIELSGLPFFEKTRKRYLQLAQQDDNIKVINTMQPIAQVHDDIRCAIQRYLEQ